MDSQRIRAQFPMLKQKMHGKGLIYLDSAATSLKPQSVIDAITDFYTNNYGTVHRAIYQLSLHSTELYNKARLTLQRFINADSEKEVIFTKGCTEGVNLVATILSYSILKEGDEVLVSDLEHHSNIVPWQLACERTGAKLKVIPSNANGQIDLNVFKQHLTGHTKVVAIQHVSNFTGTVHPIKQMADLAHEVGAFILVDGAQSCPHQPIDVQKLGVDFFTVSGHKMYGPTGIGILYGKKELLEKLPVYHGGGDMIDQVTFEKTTYNDLPFKYEAGTPPIAQVIGLAAAAEFMIELGRENIYAYEHMLSTYLYNQLKTVKGVNIIGPEKERSSLVSFSVDGAHPLDVGSLLDTRGVAIRTGHHCVQPALEKFGLTSSCRASIGIYNTKEEIDQFIEHLTQVIDLLT